MRDLEIHLTHRPGELARVAEALGRYGVNIKSLAALEIDQHAIVRILPDDIEPARTALEQANVRFSEGELVTVLLENRAGEVARIAAKLAEGKVNLRALYVTGLVDNLVELAIVADDPKKAKRLLA
jgi:acetolactate synthase small subunit